MSIVTAPTLQQLTSEFNFIRNSELEGVKGIWRVDSGKSGPVLGITIHTHGNEPSGIATLWYLRNKFKLTHNLRHGSVFFVINNLKATERYFTALKMSEGKEKENAKRTSRFCDHNMNRLPKNTINLRNDSRYEICRSQELLPIWKNFEVAFDIHSVAKKSVPMIIACGGLQKDLIKGFPVDIIITNIENIQVEKPAVSFYGQKGKIKTLAIEAGSHEDSSSFECSITCTVALLQNLDFVDGDNNAEPKEYQEYIVNGSVLFPHPSFRMMKVFEMFELIKKGQVLARGKGTNIVAASDGHALMGRPTLKAESIKEEVLFLSRPVKKLKI